MTKKDVFDGRFAYFLHGTSKGTAIADYFQKGIIIYGTSMPSIQDTGSIALSEQIEQYGLDAVCSNYADKCGYDNVYVIKIPSYYLGWQHRNGEMPPLVPVLKPAGVENGLQIYAIHPNLIEGVFQKQTNKFTKNGKYNPLYDPTGMYYDRTQIGWLQNYDYETFKFAMDRIKYFSPDNALKADKQNNTWHDVAKYYGIPYSNDVFKRISSFFK